MPRSDRAKMICWDLDLITDLWETSADLSDFYGLPRGVDYSQQPSSAPLGSPSGRHPGCARGPTAGDRNRRADALRVPRAGTRRGWPAALVLDSRAGAPRRDRPGTAARGGDNGHHRTEAGGGGTRSPQPATARRPALGKPRRARRWDRPRLQQHPDGDSRQRGTGPQADPRENPAVPHLDQIDQASRRAADLCRQLLAYAGRGHAQVGKTDVNQLIRNSTALLAIPTTKSAGIRFDLADGLPQVSADAAPVRQVLVNLVMNAAEAIGEAAGEVTVATQLVEVPTAIPVGYQLPPQAGRYVRLVVTDTGPGIPLNVGARMFDPFFTTKFAGRGLGLAAVLGIMRAHHGAIRVSSEPGKARLGRNALAGGGVLGFTVNGLGAAVAHGRALVVDDEMYVREVTASTVQELGLEPLLAGDAATALALFQQYRNEIRVAVLDVVMPGMSGDQLLRELRVLAPALPARAGEWVHGPPSHRRCARSTHRVRPEVLPPRGTTRRTAASVGTRIATTVWGV